MNSVELPGPDRDSLNGEQRAMRLRRDPRRVAGGQAQLRLAQEDTIGARAPGIERIRALDELDALPFAQLIEAITIDGLASKKDG
jgi:hypothetical protein